MENINLMKRTNLIKTLFMQKLNATNLANELIVYDIDFSTVLDSMSVISRNLFHIDAFIDKQNYLKAAQAVLYKFLIMHDDNRLCDEDALDYTSFEEVHEVYGDDAEMLELHSILNVLLYSFT